MAEIADLKSVQYPFPNRQISRQHWEAGRFRTAGSGRTTRKLNELAARRRLDDMDREQAKALLRARLSRLDLLAELMAERREAARQEDLNDE